MTELPWATPRELGKLTLVQLVCLGSEDEPDRASRRARTADEFRRLMALACREEREWDGVETG